MMKEQRINKLEAIKAKNFDFSDVNKDALAETMLENIGHKDSVIRDDLIYPVLAHLLYDDHFSEEKLTKILYRLLDSDHLMYGLNNSDKYSVLTRSFSALQITVLLDVHRHQHLIDKKVIERTFTTFLDYFEKEQVLSGFNREVGWMHAVAHSADVFNAFMQVAWIGEAELKTMFEAIGRKMKQGTHCFIFNEDERMAVALKNGIERNILPERYLKAWIDQVATYDSPASLPEKIYLHRNVKNLLRSLYFKLIGCKAHETLTAHLQNHLKLKPEVS